MTRLRLVYSSSKNVSDTLNTSQTSVASSRGSCSRLEKRTSSLQRKVVRLERLRPAAAAAVELLVDDVLDEVMKPS